MMEQRVLQRPEVVKLLKKFVTVQLYTDFVPINSITPAQREVLAKDNHKRLTRLGEAINPYFVILSPSGDLLAQMGGYHEPPAFVDFLTKALGRLPTDKNVAQTARAPETR